MTTISHLHQNLLFGTALVFLLPAITRALPNGLAAERNLTLQLQRGSFTVRRYQARLQPGTTSPKALIVFGSGCGGWTEWESKVCLYLQGEGYEVLGIDFAQYAQNDYDAPTLNHDYRAIVKAGLAPYASHPPPVILGGWSTGAEQAAAVASGSFPPAQLVGLLLISPGSEGGYGAYAVEYVTLDPPADRYFLMAELAPKITNVRVAQWHAGYDPLDSCSWLRTLKAPHREFDYPYAIHDFGDASPDFLRQLSASVAWILAQPPVTVKPSVGK